MTPTTAPAPPRPHPQGHAATSARRRRSATRLRRRRRIALAAGLSAAALAVAVAAGLGPLGEAVREFTLPLRHDDVIRQQARDKGLDAALIAAVIYQESKFQDRTSEAGATGLMQILPDTARFIASKSGGTEFEVRDLGNPQINIAYGAWYLRYLIDRYDGNETLAVAAYNAGGRNVDEWVREAGGADGFDPARDVPFPETRAYVEGVSERREQYREHYADDLGL